MIRGSFKLIFLVITASAFGQEVSIETEPRKGSYLYYGQPAFEDNSFLLDEAINQERGVMQFVSNIYFDNSRGGNFLYSFTHQIPIASRRHEVDYTLFYYYQNTSEQKGGGFGDMNVTYHFMAMGKEEWIMFVPSFTLIIPTGKTGFDRGALAAN